MKNLLLNIKLMFASLFVFQKPVFAAEPLSLDLQFFAEPEDPKDPPADPPKQVPKNEPPADDPDKHMVPRSRFNEINDSYKTVKDQLDQLLQEKEDADRQAKEKQGEYQTLYETANEQLDTYKTDFETTKSRVEALEGVMTSMLETKMESIPEDYHDLIPDNLSSEQKLDWITKAEAKGLFGTRKSEEPLGGPTNPSNGKTDFENMNSFQLLQAGYGSKK